MSDGPWKVLPLLLRDPKIRCHHLAIYLALCDLWQRYGHGNEVRISRSIIMHLAKIRASGTYHKYIQQLQDYDYIIYVPSYHPARQTLVFFKI